jgi:hypothetical protein
MNILNISTKEFLEKGLKLGDDALNEYNKISLERRFRVIEPHTDEAYNSVYGGAYLHYAEENITTELNEILNETDYKTIEYNNENVNYIIKKLNLNPSHYEIKILDSIVYCEKQRRRAEAENKAYLEREAKALAKGYTKTEIKEAQKLLDHKKVIGIFNLSKIGILGSFNEWVEIEGTLIYSEAHNTLVLMPKRHTRTGYPLLNYAYIKVVK